MPTSTTNFMLIADPQLGIAAFLLDKHNGRTEPREYGESIAPPGTPLEGWPYELDRLNRVIEVANELKPDFIAVLGDMVMRWNDHGQVVDVLRAFENLSTSIPVHWVPGNHDVGVDYFAATDRSLADYRDAFGPDRYTFTSGPCRVIVLNSPLYDRPDSAPMETQAQHDWLESQLAESPQGIHHTIVFMHHPPIIRSIDEEFGAYNLPDPGRSQLLDLLDAHGVQYIFAGHTHTNVIARHEDVRIIATSAIGVARAGSPSGYRLVQATPNEISHSFHAMP